MYSLNYLLRFNADKIDEVIDLNLLAIQKTKEGMIKIPLIAISLLEKHPTQLRWDANRSTWTFLDTFTLSRRDFSSDFMFYSPDTIEQLKNDYGLFGTVLRGTGQKALDQRINFRGLLPIIVKSRKPIPESKESDHIGYGSYKYTRSNRRINPCTIKQNWKNDARKPCHDHINDHCSGNDTTK